MFQKIPVANVQSLPKPLCKNSSVGSSGSKVNYSSMILVSLFSFNMFQPSSSTRSTKEKHIFDLVTAVPVTTQPPPPPPSRPTQPGLQPAGPKLSRTRLSAEPLNGVVAILEYQNSLGKAGEVREIFWMILSVFP